MRDVKRVNHSENSTPTLTEKADRHFEVLQRPREGEREKGALHLITAVYPLHPLDKFTSLKEISGSPGGPG